LRENCQREEEPSSFEKGGKRRKKIYSPKRPGGKELNHFLKRGGKGAVPREKERGKMEAPFHFSASGERRRKGIQLAGKGEGTSFSSPERFPEKRKGTLERDPLRERRRRGILFLSSPAIKKEIRRRGRSGFSKEEGGGEETFLCDEREETEKGRTSPGKREERWHLLLFGEEVGLERGLYLCARRKGGPSTLRLREGAEKALITHSTRRGGKEKGVALHERPKKGEKVSAYSSFSPGLVKGGRKKKKAGCHSPSC